MAEKLTFKPSFHVEVVDPEGVFLLSERGHFVLKGPLYCRLAPLFDGRRSTEDIVDALAGKASPAEVYYAVARLKEKGYEVEVDHAISPDRLEFWYALGLDAQKAERRLQDTTVTLAGFGAVPLGPFASALAALGIRVGDDGDFAVALSDDYLREELEAFNAVALMSGRPWLLVKPLGTVLWIGPVFRPGHTACWECLAQRLRANREVLRYLHRKKGNAKPFPISRGTLSATLRTALELAALETAKAIAGVEQQDRAERLITLDVLTLETQQHRLVRRPQCPRCGDPAYRSDQEPVSITLESQQKQFTADGGHRTTSPEKTLERHEHHVSPITGAVTCLTGTTVDEAGFLRVYGAGHNQAMEYDSLDFLRRGLRSNSGGKGITNAQAKASGLCEALERYSGSFQGYEIRRRATYRRLGASAIHPNACMLYSEQQYQRRKEWNARGSPYLYVPLPIDEEAEIEWTPVWSLTAREFKYLPTGYLYYGYRDAAYFQADSNGNAAGNTLEEAILQGFMELAERDSVALWWYNRVQRPAVDLESFDEPYIQELKNCYNKLNREVWVLDITSDLQIPAFAAISRRIDRPKEIILLGFGAHFDPRIGVLRALTEVNQSATIVRDLDRIDDDMDFDPALAHWWQTAALANQPYLVPDDTRPRARSDYEAWWSDDVREDVLHCQEIVERQGMEMLVLDQTRPDIGLPVVKVIVPGLRHFWTRFAPGRLYDVPVTMGWLEEPLSEDQLNPMAMML
jgi:bacteriocin biosynthesis cyclodehydratase domain-containing protein